MNDQLVAPAPERPKSVVILVHGIRTNAPWIAMLRARFERAGIVVEPTNYGRLDVFRFLWGSRRGPIDAIWDSVRDVQKLYPDAKISFLAHSFGTYIIAKILQREFDFKAHRVVFCGSVVHYRFPFKQISDRFTPPLVNETSARDVWPPLAESLTWGYGSAGTYGFKIPRVRDRWHRGFGHSQYLTKEFCDKFWVPFFQSGELVEGDLVDDKPPLWIGAISVIRVKYLFLLAVLAATMVLIFRSPVKYPGPIGSELPGQMPAPLNQVTVPELGSPPRPGCYVVQIWDSTVMPPRNKLVWKCP